MKAPKSMVGIFNDLTNNRKEALAARTKYVVVSVKKDGTPRKVTPDDLHGLNAVETLEQATVRVAAMQALNPGKAFAVITL